MTRRKRARLWRSDEPLDKIVMPEHDCVETPVLMWPDTKISGIVRSVEGSRIAGIKVVAYEWDSGNRRRTARSAMTGEDGRYVIQRLLAGRYAVAIALKSGSDEAYPASFHPSAPTLQGATPVNIADGKSADRVDIVVHPNRKAVTIKVGVLGPDKRPVAMAMILAEHPEDGGLRSRPSLRLYGRGWFHDHPVVRGNRVHAFRNVAAVGTQGRWRRRKDPGIASHEPCQADPRYRSDRHIDTKREPGTLALR